MDNKNSKYNESGINNNTYNLLFSDYDNIPKEEQPALEKSYIISVIQLYTRFREKSIFSKILKLNFERKYKIDFSKIKFNEENQNYEYEFQGEVYTFDKLSKKINDKNIKKELESEKRYRNCHLKSAEIATSLPKSCILTGYVKRYNGKFLHSIVEIEKEDGKYIIDYTKNIIMPKEQYVKLTEFEELESISDLEYLEYIQRLENILDLNGKVLLTFGREIFKELEKNSFLIKSNEDLEKVIDKIKAYKLKERENNSKEIDNEERE
mgnify:FL=1